MDFRLIPGFNPGPYTGSGNNTYLVGGREPTLIDAGAGDPRHLEAVDRELAGASLRRVIVTHGHSDHVSGSDALAQRWPEAEFLKMPWPDRDGRHDVGWTSLADGDRIPAGDGELRVVHTPGHAPDHICLYDERTEVLFCGDLVIQGRTVVIPASGGGSLPSYLESLARVRALAPRRVLPAHGPEIGDLPALIDEYLEHRRHRDAEVLDALAAGAFTPAQLVERIYTDLRPALRVAAEETVLAHLLKLRDEGRVRERGHHWELNVPPRGDREHHVGQPQRLRTS